MSSSRRRPERRLSIAQGRDAREIQLPPSAGKCFLLTSPFIERLSIAQGRDAREIQLPPSAGKCFLLTSPFIERLQDSSVELLIDVRSRPHSSRFPQF